jgi:Heavy-metal resistance
MDLSGTVRKEEMAMEPLLAADQPDEGKILAQIDRLAQARAELERANARMFLGLCRVLTPEQWKTLQGRSAPRTLFPLRARAAKRLGSELMRHQGPKGGAAFVNGFASSELFIRRSKACDLSSVIIERLRQFSCGLLVERE